LPPQTTEIKKSIIERNIQLIEVERIEGFEGSNAPTLYNYLFY
jgi:hypothetical protein